MIHRLVRKVSSGVRNLLTRAPRTRRPPKRIAASEHGIDRSLVTKAAIKTCETLQAAGFKAYVVGGAVRDLALGGRPKDYDVATSATPDEVRVRKRARSRPADGGLFDSLNDDRRTATG